MIVIARDCNIGDALCALPTICALAKQHAPDPLYLAMTNKQVLAIADLPDNVVNIMDAEPHWRSAQMQVQMLGVGAACNYFPHTATLHPIHFLMAWAGLDVDVADLPQPQLNVPDMPCPTYDVLLSFHNEAKERRMTGHAARELCSKMKAQGWNVAIVGGAGEQSQLVDFPKSTDFSSGYWGQDFGYVVNLMRRAKCVVTIDSGPGRLAHAAGVGDRHIVLDSGATPWRSQSHPGAVRVKGGMQMGQAFWHTDDILTAIKGVLSV